MAKLLRLLEKNKPTNPELWQKFVKQAKQKFDVYPSAYANGWAAKQYKAAGGGWKTEEAEEPQHVAVALRQTKEVDPKKIGEMFVEYLEENGMKHSAYMNEDGHLKLLGLNKDKVKEILKELIREFETQGAVVAEDVAKTPDAKSAIQSRLSTYIQRPSNLKNKMGVKLKHEGGLPGGAGVGLNLPSGYINGAPSEDDVKAVKKKLKESVGDTILQQLGGNRFVAMTGAKNFFKDDKEGTLTFKIGRNSKNVNIFRITHNPKDLYDLESFRGSKVVEKREDVFNTDLRKVFTQMTGLYTTL